MLQSTFAKDIIFKIELKKLSYILILFYKLLYVLAKLSLSYPKLIFYLFYIFNLLIKNIC